MSQYPQVIITILSLMNPVICSAIFSKATAGNSMGVKVGDATKAVVSIAVILCAAALFGAQLLSVFGISLPAFKVAGGLVLVWMGFIMLKGNSSPTSAAKEEANASPAASKAPLTPLILFAASPGTITGVITQSVAFGDVKIPVTVLVSVGVACVITWAIMIFASRKSDVKKQGLLHDVTSRFMGLIVLAMGVQFALSGLNEFFKVAS